MSTRLDLALHDLADAAGDASTFGDPHALRTVATVSRLTGRVRRRRTARGAGTAAVAASAAGAVALVGPHLGTDVSPAVDPDAAPGTCGSSLSALPLADDEDPTVEASAWMSEDGLGVLRDGGLGAWQGATAELMASVTQTVVDGTAPAVAATLLLTDGDVVVAVADAAVPASAVTAAPVGTSAGEDQTTVVVDPGDGTVPEVRWTTAGGDGRSVASARTVRLPLTSCAGEPLPAGRYEVRGAAAVLGIADAHGEPHLGSESWWIDIAKDQPPVTGLPDGFPTDVPLIGGRLVSAQRHGDGWAAEVATPGDDRLTVASDLVATVAVSGAGRSSFTVTGGHESPQVEMFASQGAVVVPGWTVQIRESTTPDGRESVVYVLTPTD